MKKTRDVWVESYVTAAYGPPEPRAVFRMTITSKGEAVRDASKSATTQQLQSQNQRLQARIDRFFTR